MSQVKEIVVAVTSFLNSLTKAFEKYLATRQEAYNRKADKRQVACIRNADAIVDRIKELDIKDKVLGKLTHKHQTLNN